MVRENLFSDVEVRKLVLKIGFFICNDNSCVLLFCVDYGVKM